MPSHLSQMLRSSNPLQDALRGRPVFRTQIAPQSTQAVADPHESVKKEIARLKEQKVPLRTTLKGLSAMKLDDLHNYAKEIYFGITEPLTKATELKQGKYPPVVGEQGKEKIGSFIKSAQKAIVKPTFDLLNPGSTFATPGLENVGVNPMLAGAIGLGIDILTPGPGELGRGSKLVQGGKILRGTEDAAQDFSKILRGTKGMTAQDIMTKYPDIKLTRDVPATDIYGNKIEIPKGEALTPYELKGNKILLQDGDTYIVSKNQFENIKGQSVSKEAKPFALELAGTEEVVKGGAETQRLIRENPNRYPFPKEKYGTKYSQYQLPDGKNYKEILIKAPVSKDIKLPPKPEPITTLPEEYDVMHNYSPPIAGREWTVTPKAQAHARSFMADYQYRGYYPTIEEAKQAAVAKINRLSNEEYNNTVKELTKKSAFQGSHWDEPNVISHFRMNERTYKGKKVAFMEELQSDWAREGRTSGFVGSPEKLALEKELNDYRKVLEKKYPNGIDAYGDNLTTAEKTKFNELRNKASYSGVPSHPLLKNWQEPTVKRALQEAVKNNADYFSWISGEQTSARYNLATKLDNATWKSGKDGRVVTLKPKDGGTISLWMDENGKIIEAGGTGIMRGTMSEAKGKKLDEVLGKGLADKIMEKEGGTLSGEGLKFGGEWANNLYDKQVADIVRNTTGAKIEKLDMGLPISKSKDTFDIAGFDKEMNFQPSGETLKVNQLKIGLPISRGGSARPGS